MLTVTTNTSRQRYTKDVKKWDWKREKRGKLGGGGLERGCLGRGENIAEDKG